MRHEEKFKNYPKMASLSNLPFILSNILYPDFLGFASPTDSDYSPDYKRYR